MGLNSIFVIVFWTNLPMYRYTCLTRANGSLGRLVLWSLLNNTSSSNESYLEFRFNNSRIPLGNILMENKTGLAKKRIRANIRIGKEPNASGNLAQFVSGSHIYFDIQFFLHVISRLCITRRPTPPSRPLGTRFAVFSPHGAPISFNWSWKHHGLLDGLKSITIYHRLELSRLPEVVG